MDSSTVPISGTGVNGTLSTAARLELLKAERGLLLVGHDQLLSGLLVASQKIADLSRLIESMEKRSA